MTINNTIGGQRFNRIRRQPLIYGFRVTAANSSSITVNVNMNQQLGNTVSYTITPSLPTTYYSYGCHSILARSPVLGYSGPTLFSSSGIGPVGTQSVTLSGLYYDSDYVITLAITTLGATDYYSINASTTAPDDIILVGNASSVATTYTANSSGLANSVYSPLIMPRNVDSLSAVVVGAGGAGGTPYGGGGGGGALSYGNLITAFSPGSLIDYQIGGCLINNTINVFNSYLGNSSFLNSNPGNNGTSGTNQTAGGGGGAGGYSGNGGNGGAAAIVSYLGGGGGVGSGSARSGGGNGGNGGAGASSSTTTSAAGAASGGSGAGGAGGWAGPYGGGGVGLYGQSSLNNSGFTTTAGTATALNSTAASATNGGSGGFDGPATGVGAQYGGGGGPSNGGGGKSAIRICFNKKGSTPRLFPSTGVSTVPADTKTILF